MGNTSRFFLVVSKIVLTQTGWSFQISFQTGVFHDTVGGRNPGPPEMYKTLYGIFTIWFGAWFLSSTVVYCVFGPRLKVWNRMNRDSEAGFEGTFFVLSSCMFLEILSVGNDEMTCILIYRNNIAVQFHSPRSITDSLKVHYFFCRDPCSKDVPKIIHH